MVLIQIPFIRVGLIAHFQMHSHISIRGCVRPSICHSVGPLVQNTFSETRARSILHCVSDLVFLEMNNAAFFQSRLMSGYIFFSFQAVMIGISLGTLSLFTVVGNTMVLHAVKTERRLQTVRVTGLSKCRKFGQKICSSYRVVYKEFRRQL